MKEDKLQSDIVRKFSELYPKKRKQLIHPANERNSKLQAFKAISLGIVSGVPDLIFFNENKDVGTELKTPGSRHKKDKVLLQVKYGELWESLGKVWRLCRTVEEAISCYEGKPKGLTTKEVRQLLEQTKTKTIKF